MDCCWVWLTFPRLAAFAWLLQSAHHFPPHSASAAARLSQPQPSTQHSLTRSPGRFVGNFSPQNKKNIPVTELTDLLDAMMMIDRDRFICMHKTAVALNLHNQQTQWALNLHEASRHKGWGRAGTMSLHGIDTWDLMRNPCKLHTHRRWIPNTMKHTIIVIQLQYTLLIVFLTVAFINFWSTSSLV